MIEECVPIFISCLEKERECFTLPDSCQNTTASTKDTVASIYSRLAIQSGTVDVVRSYHYQFQDFSAAHWFLLSFTMHHFPGVIHSITLIDVEQPGFKK